MGAASSERHELLIVDHHWPSARTYAQVLAPLGDVVITATADDAVRWVGEHLEVAAILCFAELPDDGAQQLRRLLNERHPSLLARIIEIQRGAPSKNTKDSSPPVTTSRTSDLLRKVQQLTAVRAES